MQAFYYFSNKHGAELIETIGHLGRVIRRQFLSKVSLSNLAHRRLLSHSLRFECPRSRLRDPASSFSCASGFVVFCDLLFSVSEPGTVPSSPVETALRHRVPRWACCRVSFHV